jgi:hypothetical protein
LSSVDFDRNYQNPFDFSLSAYLWALFESRHKYPEYLQLGLDYASGAEDTWWVPRVIGAIKRDVLGGEATNTVVGQPSRHVDKSSAAFAARIIRYTVRNVAAAGATANTDRETLNAPFSVGEQISTSTTMVA